MVRAAYELLKNNVLSRILGKDLGRGLLAYVDAARAANVTELLRKVETLTAKAFTAQRKPRPIGSGGWTIQSPT